MEIVFSPSFRLALQLLQRDWNCSCPRLSLPWSRRCQHVCPDCGMIVQSSLPFGRITVAHTKPNGRLCGDGEFRKTHEIPVGRSSEARQRTASKPSKKASQSPAGSTRAAKAQPASQPGLAPLNPSAVARRAKSDGKGTFGSKRKSS